MFFRIIAFLVGLIAVITGLLKYDNSIRTALVPLVTGGLVMFIALFNLLPKIKLCPVCNKKIANSATTCRFCGVDLTKDDSIKYEK